MKIFNVTDKLIKILIYTHICMWVLFLPIIEFQMMIFGKKIIGLFHFSILEMILVILILINYKQKFTISSIFRKTFILILVMFSVWIIGTITNYTTVIYWKLYYLIYWIMPLIVLIVSFQNNVNFNNVKKFMLAVCITHAILIIFQHYDNDIFWPFMFDSEGTQLFYVSQGYYNQGMFMERCPGICTSGLDAGILLIFGIIINTTNDKMKKLNKLILNALFLIAIVFTGTRNIFVQIIYIIVLTCVSYASKLSKKQKKIITVILTLIAAFLYFLMFFRFEDGISTKNILTDTLSAGIRLDNWIEVINTIFKTGISGLIFGLNVWQGAGFSVVIDNMYLELLVVSGIIGMIFYINYYIFLANYVNNNSFNSILFSSFILSVFVFGVANVIGNLFFTLIILIVLFCKDEDIKKRCR